MTAKRAKEIRSLLYDIIDVIDKSQRLPAQENTTITTLKEARESVERNMIIAALIKYPTATVAATHLGISHATLYRKSQLLGIDTRSRPCRVHPDKNTDESAD